MLSFKSAASVCRSRILLSASIVAVCSFICAGAASAQTLNTLANFNSTNGDSAYAGLIADAYGNLFGTTVFGGPSNDGLVFELTYNAVTGTYASSPVTLVAFNGVNGSGPVASLIFDAKGDLLGTTRSGGTSNDGTVFEISYNATTGTYASSPTTLVAFNGTNGQQPEANLMADANGDLFGTTFSGGSSDYGTVFEIGYNAATGAYASSLTTLVSFDYAHGGFPTSGLMADASGNLFGTTLGGGTFYDGTVYEIPYNAASGTHATSPTVLVHFNGTDGANPDSGLITDANGDLFGTTNAGGAFHDGTVFEIPYNTATGSYSTSPTTLVAFDGNSLSFPVGGLIADANGNLFGTATGENYGGVFEIVKTSGGYASTPVDVITFAGADGSHPYAGVIANASGDLFGTTYGGGTDGAGTVFEIQGSGFVSTARFAGTPGKGNCNGVSTSTLANTYGGIAHAASTLGYGSVANLKSAINTYCSR